MRNDLDLTELSNEPPSFAADLVAFLLPDRCQPVLVRWGQAENCSCLVLIRFWHAACVSNGTLDGRHDLERKRIEMDHCTAMRLQGAGKSFPACGTEGAVVVSQVGLACKFDPFTIGHERNRTLGPGLDDEFQASRIPVVPDDLEK